MSRPASGEFSRHDAARPRARLGRRDSALAVFLAAAHATRRSGTDVVWTSGAGCVLQCSDWCSASTSSGAPAFPAGRCDSVLRLDALALHHRSRLRRVHADMGVQRPVVDGALRLDRRDGESKFAADVFTGGAADLARFPAVNAAAWHGVLGGRGIKEVEFVRIQDEHYYVVRQTPHDAAAKRRAERLHQPYYVTGRAEPDRCS